jgi:hypothetical protein
MKKVFVNFEVPKIFKVPVRRSPIKGPIPVVEKPCFKQLKYQITFFRKNGLSNLEKKLRPRIKRLLIIIRPPDLTGSHPKYPHQGSISSTFYVHFLQVKIPKVQKIQSSRQFFLRFWDLCS